MKILCRIGLHRWTFNTELLDESGRHVPMEVIHARCRRTGCVRYANWSLVHREAHGVAESAAQDSPVSLA
jgi:hypothetical protein